jgi:hypothetical protein
MADTQEFQTMSPKYCLYTVLGALVLMGLGGCIVTPIGEGHGGGGGGEREHEDRDHHDRGDEHRHDFGVNQKERFGFYQPYGTERGTPVWKPAIFIPEAHKHLHHGLWA